MDDRLRALERRALHGTDQEKAEYLEARDRVDPRLRLELLARFAGAIAFRPRAIRYRIVPDPVKMGSTPERRELFGRKLFELASQEVAQGLWACEFVYSLPGVGMTPVPGAVKIVALEPLPGGPIGRAWWCPSPEAERHSRGMRHGLPKAAWLEARWDLVPNGGVGGRSERVSFFPRLHREAR